MHVLVTGATGFIGSALLRELAASGAQLTILSRQAQPLLPVSGCRCVQSLDEIAPGEVLTAVVNLAGASLAARRWSAQYKRTIVDSRMDTTRAVVQLMARLEQPPQVLLNASAIGYYGHQDDSWLEESSVPNPGFSQQLCQDWEALALQAQTAATRVCLLRLGVVLDAGGGALQPMAQSFRLGVTSWMGAGSQWLSWVHRRDVVRALCFLMERDDLQGAFNITAPQPVRAREFAVALGRHHRTFIRAGVPAPLARVLLGEMADELLLNGQRVAPAALQDARFSFEYAELPAALEAIYAV